MLVKDGIPTIVTGWHIVTCEDIGVLIAWLLRGLSLWDCWLVSLCSEGRPAPGAADRHDRASERFAGQPWAVSVLCMSPWQAKAEDQVEDWLADSCRGVSVKISEFSKVKPWETVCFLSKITFLMMVGDASMNLDPFESGCLGLGARFTKSWTRYLLWHPLAIPLLLAPGLPYFCVALITTKHTLNSYEWGFTCYLYSLGNWGWFRWFADFYHQELWIGQLWCLIQACSATGASPYP